MTYEEQVAIAEKNGTIYIEIAPLLNHLRDIIDDDSAILDDFHELYNINQQEAFNWVLGLGSFETIQNSIIREIEVLNRIIGEGKANDEERETILKALDLYSKLDLAT